MKKRANKFENDKWDINDIDSELLENELNDIDEFLSTYTVETANKEDISETIEVLRGYMPKREFSKKKDSKCWALIGNQISYMSKAYWIFSILFQLVGLAIFNNYIESSPYLFMLVASPVPIIVGFSEIFKGRDEGVWELEMSYKYDFKNLFLLKLTIVGIFSAILNVILSVIIVKFYTEVSFVRLNITWILPYLFVSAMSLIVASKFRGSNIIMITCSIWLLCFFTVGKELVDKILNLDLLVLITLVFIAFLFMFITIKKHVKLLQSSDSVF